MLFAVYPIADRDILVVSIIAYPGEKYQICPHTTSKIMFLKGCQG